jgi:hypothetical protein
LEKSLYRRPAIVVIAVLSLLGLTSSFSSAASWNDHGWGRLAVKAYASTDRCKNIAGVQTKVPAGHERDAQGNCHPTSTTTQPTTPTTPASVVPAPQAGFSRVFADEFDGTAVDTSKWGPYTGHLTSSSGCNEPDNLSVSGGVLTMLFAYQPSGVCGANWYHGSMKVDRAYSGNNQSVTVRYRVLNNDPSNTRAHRIMPMRWPSSGPDGGTSPPGWHGEADYCEGSSLTHCKTFLHYAPSSESPYQVASPEIVFDATQWHTIRATQYAGNDVAVFVDDMATPVWYYDGTTTTVPDVMRRTVLQQECPSSCPTDTHDWERIEVDFVTIDNQS